MNDRHQASSDGRTNQKARTRAALLASAIQLVRAGRRPTVEEAALAAGISKRTAYRYFTSQEHMLADAALEGLRGRMEEVFANPAAADAHTRLNNLASALRQLGETHETELRMMMRASLDMHLAVRQQPAALPARGKRRLDWIRTALQPVEQRFSTADYSKLVSGLAVCLGIDALIVLRDVCGLDSEASEDLMKWMATALLDRALAETPGD